MPMRNLAWLSGAALLSLFFAANAALAERESDGRSVGLGERVTDAACAASGDGDQSAVCQDGRLLWRYRVAPGDDKLVSYDQVTRRDDNNWSLTYLTIVGAFVIPATDHDVATMVDLAVVDPASRSLVLRAAMAAPPMPQNVAGSTASMAAIRRAPRRSPANSSGVHRHWAAKSADRAGS